MSAAAMSIVRHVVPCFEAPWAWKHVEPLSFVHASGIVVHLVVEQDLCSSMFLVDVFWEGIEEWLVSKAVFDLPQITLIRKLMFLGTLSTPNAGVSLQDFQQALHAQWGLGALQRARAISHVVAEHFNAHGGEWVEENNKDAIYIGDGSPHPLTGKEDRIVRCIRAHHLCYLSDTGQFLPLPSMELQRLPTGHARLDMAKAVMWAQSLCM